MLKITMMLGSFDKLLGESNVAQAIDVRGLDFDVKHERHGRGP